MMGIRIVPGATAGILLMLSLLCGPASAPAQEGAVNLQEVLEAAIKDNPEISAARERWEAARARIPQAGALPDPVFGYTHFGEEVETRDGPQEKAYQIAQKFPALGKLRLRTQAATHHAAMVEQQYNATVREVASAVKKSYYELYWVHRATGITGEMKELLQRLEKVAATRYATGKGGQQSVLKAQLEISKLNDRLLALEQMKTTVVARLNALLNRPPGAALGVPGDFEISLFEHDLEELYSMGAGQRQEVKAAGLAVEQARASHQLARKEYLPDLTAAVRYIEIGEGSAMSPDSGDDAWAAMLSINLPIWRGRLKGAVDEASARLRSSEDQLEGVKTKTAFQIKDTYFRAVTARDEIELYRDSLIPQADGSLKATEAAYETGTATFLDLLDSERTFLAIKIGYHRAMADYEKNLADLERAVGTDLVGR